MSPAVDRLRVALTGRYELDREIGRGGMAIVYLARDVRHDRQVAVKVFDGEVAAAVGADRFLREIRTAAGLTHPHILPVHDSGSADGVLYYIMPFVSGESLRDRLRREKQLPVADAIRIACEVAQALDFAHRHDIVHRDVKPENILLQDGHSFILDFGIARAIDGPQGGLTQTGLVIGTAAYMSPEQATGQSIDGRSDLYSLGCVLYEMLSGFPPVNGPTAQAVLTQRLTTPATPVRAHRPNVPAAVDRALGRALQIAPADRFRTAGDFARAIDGDRDHTSSVTEDRPEAMSPAKPRMHGRFRRAGAAMLAAGAVAGAWYWAASTKVSPDRGAATVVPATQSIAVLPFVNMSAEASNEYFSDGMTEELINALSRIQGLRVTSRTSVFTFKGEPANVRQIAARLGVGWVLEGSVRKDGSRLKITAQLIDARDDSQKWSDTYERELKDVFTIQNEIARAIVTALSVRLSGDPSRTLVGVPTRHLAAYQLYLEGRFFYNRRDDAGLQRAIELFGQAIAIDPDYALAHAGLGDAFAILGGNGHRPPSDAFPKAQASIARAVALDPSLAQPHAALGLVKTQYEWDFNGALNEYRVAEALNPGYASVAHWRAWTLVGLGRVEEALTEIRRAESLDPLSLVINAQVGAMLYYLRRYDEAERAYRKALDRDPGFAMAHWYLASSHVQRGRFDEALAEARLASTLFGEPSMMRVLAPVYAAAGRRNEAEAALKQLSALSARTYVPDLDFATIHMLLGNRDEALTRLEHAVEGRAADLFLIRVDPVWDAVRDEPRFRQVLRAMNMK